MAEQGIVEAVRNYLKVLPHYGVHAQRAILFGSYAVGGAQEWSDIDVVVLAPEFDAPYTVETVKRLWRATVKADNRIEPIACGVREWETDDSRPILEIARREGIEIAA